MARTGRREFLAGCGGAMLVMGAPAGTRVQEESLGHQFQFSVAAYSYRNLLQGNPPVLSLDDFVTDCARMGVDGVELTSYYFPKDVDLAFLRALKRHCFRLGLDVSGTAVGNDFGHPEEAKRREQIDHVKLWCRYAEVLGAPVIRVFAGYHKQGQNAADTHRWMVEGLQESCDTAAEHGVHLALENHGGPTATAEGLLKIYSDVNHPWFGINLDTGNFHSADLYGELATAAPQAINVQVKVAVSGPDRVKKPSDYAKLNEILRAAKYRGYVVLEYEEGGDPRQECPRHLNELRAALA